MSEELIAAAREAKGRAYAPYSHFTVGYDSASGRIASADIGGMAHTWSYLEGSDLKSRLDYRTVGSAEWTYETNRDLLTQVRNSAHGSGISQYDYTNDAAGRRMSKNNERYGYNERSELISATGNGNYSYTYDDIGNRISSIEPDNSFSYLANSLNQYTGISAVNLNLEPQPFIPQYDLDGNQTLIKTKTGIWSVLYNGENRPIDWSCGSTNIVMKYDRMGRRVEYLETVADVDDSTVTTNKHQRFVYDNYLCVERHSVTNDATSLTDVFVWDPTEPIATRPLQWRTSSGTYLYFHDGNKNVTDVVSASSASEAGHYDYAPFGESSFDDLADTNPWRFSSEAWDVSIAVVYYNYRHYIPVTGRWLGRDLAEEFDFGNLYMFVGNDSIRYEDFLGLYNNDVERISVPLTENCGRKYKAYKVKTEAPAFSMEKTESVTIRGAAKIPATGGFEDADLLTLPAGSGVYHHTDGDNGIPSGSRAFRCYSCIVVYDFCCEKSGNSGSNVEKQIWSENVSGVVRSNDADIGNRFWLSNPTPDKYRWKNARFEPNPTSENVFRQNCERKAKKFASESFSLPYTPTL